MIGNREIISYRECENKTASVLLRGEGNDVDLLVENPGKFMKIEGKSHYIAVFSLRILFKCDDDSC